jgi:hypothetical protein
LFFRNERDHFRATIAPRPALLAQTRPREQNGIMITLEILRCEERAAILRLLGEAS